MKKIKTAILGCTGLVGQQFVRLLADHPFFALSCLTASGRSAGKTYAEAMEDSPGSVAGTAARAQVIRETTAAAVIGSGAKVVFSALPASVSAPLETELRAAGLGVFSNASSMRMEADVPLLIPEVNSQHLALVEIQQRSNPGFIVTNPNCVVSGLAIALKPLMALGLRCVTVTTFQAISGAGRRGVAAWDIMGNVVPHIANEEGKIVRETRKILGTLAGDHVAASGLDVFPACSRVPVKDGHLQSISAEFAKPVSGEALEQALAGFTAKPQQLQLPTAPRRPVIVLPGLDRPQPLLDAYAGEPGRAAGMAVSVGRLRPQGKRFAFFLLVHNTIRGAAGGSVLNAELAAMQGLLPGGAPPAGGRHEHD